MNKLKINNYVLPPLLVHSLVRLSSCAAGSAEPVALPRAALPAIRVTKYFVINRDGEI